MSDETTHLPAASASDFSEVREWYDPTRLDRVRRSSQRSANAVHDAFDLIGGTPRLAEWAHENPETFYTKLFNKTIERTSAVEHSGEITIVSAIPRTVLDGECEDISDV
jgi:hypothetical protein